MRKTLSLAAAVFALAMATPVGGADDKAGAKDNMPPEGFKALFNGTDLANWKANDKIKEHWKVVDGIIVYDGKSSDLVSDKNFKNFVLLVDWKIGKGADSGIYIRGQPQVQIWDNKEGSGGLWNDGNKPTKNVDKPIGEWNRFEITVEKGPEEKTALVTVVLNGEKVVDKFKKKMPAMGPVHLQNHGNPLWFKNIYIKELPH